MTRFLATFKMTALKCDDPADRPASECEYVCDVARVTHSFIKWCTWGATEIELNCCRNIQSIVVRLIGDNILATHEAPPHPEHMSLRCIYWEIAQTNHLTIFDNHLSKNKCPNKQMPLLFLLFRCSRTSRGLCVVHLVFVCYIIIIVSSRWPASVTIVCFVCLLLVGARGWTPKGQ